MNIPTPGVSAHSDPRDAIIRFGEQVHIVTVEQCAWLALFVAAVLTRFWSLGTRALHHDESLHAWFSYQYAIGKGYVHDPLMHGPFLFHLQALIYALFGATDATSRYGVALFGVILVMLPILLRPIIGRWGSLICSVLFLISPSILYYSRLLRHDIYLMVFTFLIIVAIARYMQLPQARWIYVGTLSLALAHTNHEASYIIAVLFGAFLFLIITWRAVKSLLAATVGYLFLLAATVVVLPKAFHFAKLPQIPWDAAQGQMNWAHWGPYLRALLVHPTVGMVLTLTVLYAITAVYLLSTIRLREAEPGTTPNDRLFGGSPVDSTVSRFHYFLADRRTIFGAVGVSLFVWTLLYTSLFTNIGGIFSGAGYSIIYWLGQQDVFRGGQPWYYFVFLFPLSGPLSFLIGLAVAGVTAYRFIQYLCGKREMTIRLFTQVMLTWYGVGMFGALSAAGEKMPWLVCHIILPFTILAASLLGEAVEYLTALWRDRPVASLPAHAAPRPLGALGIVATAPRVHVGNRLWVSRCELDCAVIGGVGIFLAGWFFAVSRVSADPAGDIRFLLLAMPVVLIALFALYAIQFGLKHSLSVAAIAVALPLALFEVHLGWHLAFFGGDTPTDMLVYTQTSPDIPMLMHDINQLSIERTGSHNLQVWCSASAVWPMQWYLRDYIAAGDVQFFGSGLAGQTMDGPPETAAPPDNIAVIMVGGDDIGTWEDQYLQNYDRTDYAMRWWFPEEIYRPFTYSPPAPRPDYPGLWKQGIVPQHTDPATGKVIAAAPGEVRPSWGDTLKKAWQSIASLGENAKIVQVPETDPQGEPLKDAKGAPVVKTTITTEPAANLWRFVALREPPHTIDSYNFHLYVRKDLVPEFNERRYK